jgi:uncharacterized protein HemY
MNGKGLWLVVGALMLVPVLALFIVSISDASRTAADPPPAPSTAGSSVQSSRVEPGPPPSGPLAESERIARSDPKRSRALLFGALDESTAVDALMLRLSEKLLMDENHREARAMVLRFLAANPKNHRCQELRLHILTPQKVHDDTTPFLGNCLERDPKSEPCLAATVVEAVRNEQPEEASKAADALRAAHPESALSYLSDGRIASLSGDYAEARERFEKACEAGQRYGCHRAEALRKEGW